MAVSEPAIAFLAQRAGQTPGLTNGDGTSLTVNGQTTYPSEALNENQREINHFAILEHILACPVIDGRLKHHKDNLTTIGVWVYKEKPQPPKHPAQEQPF